jgi:hypothetical protein
MIVADHAMAESLVDTRQAVADHRRPQVPHVHRLGDVGGREIDDDRLCTRRSFQAQRLVRHELCKRPGDPRVVEPNIEKTGARHFKWCGERPEIHSLRHLRGQIARFAREYLGQRHAAIGLIVAKLGIARGANRLFERGPVDILG